MIRQASNQAIAQQLALLRSQTQLTGLLTELQADQLRIWGGMIFRTAFKEAQVDPRPEKRKVIYLVGALDKDENLLKGLGRSVRWLLGGNFGLEVTAEGWTWNDHGDPTWQDRKKKPQSSRRNKKPKKTRARRR